ncbi:MAG: NAD(P)-dependent oxidoreductase, partial [Desulfovibrio sp.]|nr:NAD(P)-dependent oxidoreductase [Desulfovibrio sp.]
MRQLRGKTILVLGGTGFLGRHLLPRLLEADAEIVCLARDPAKISDNRVRVIKGDLTDGSGLAEAVEGAEFVIHMAALLFGLGWQEYLRANAQAASNIIRLLADSSAKFIFISSLAAAGPSSTGAKESDAPSPVSAYGWSKLLSENIIRSRRPDSLIFRPPIIYGSGDKGLLPLFRSTRRGFAPSSGMGRKFPVSAIHADDVVRAVLLGLEKDASGIYHLSDGQTRSLDDLCLAMAKAQGRESVRMLRLPLPLMKTSAALASAWAVAANSAGIGVAPPKWNPGSYTHV